MSGIHCSQLRGIPPLLTESKLGCHSFNLHLLKSPGKKAYFLFLSASGSLGCSTSIGLASSTQKKGVVSHPLQKPGVQFPKPIQTTDSRKLTLACQEKHGCRSKIGTQNGTLVNGNMDWWFYFGAFPHGKPKLRDAVRIAPLESRDAW